MRRYWDGDIYDQEKIEISHSYNKPPERIEDDDIIE